jgi:hypothetical protein
MPQRKPLTKPHVWDEAVAHAEAWRRMGGGEFRRWRRTPTNRGKNCGVLLLSCSHIGWSLWGPGRSSGIPSGPIHVTAALVGGLPFDGLAVVPLPRDEEFQFCALSCVSTIAWANDGSAQFSTFPYHHKAT